MSNLDHVLKDFRSDVERTEHLLNLIKTFREFGASTPPSSLHDGTTKWTTAMSLYDASKLRRTDLPILSGSLQLYLAGRFEYCIKQVVEVVADEIASRALKYANLPDCIKSELRIKTLEIAQNPRKYGFDDNQADAILTAFVESKADENKPINISSAALSITESNMKDRILTDILKRVGIQDYWKDVGKQTAIKLELETSSDGETTAKAQATLNAIMDERNQIAHPTSTTQFPDPDQVLNAARFLKTLACTTIDLAKIYLAANRPS
ncbi:HEPN domain-containing protein [Derxia lacustris]|uniref:HEPN domain-containing protein n=1 Tax=Derxia lacustris TaxID=764842 RepID=UPI00111BFB96|nr:MAE_28990/MAE_18760 family HEPN-like nuclease [Derxia lacustris]